MIYSAFQVLFCLCHAKCINLDIKPVHDQGFVLTLTPYARDSIKLVASIAPYSFMHAGNGYNEFYTISAYCSTSPAVACGTVNAAAGSANTSRLLPDTDNEDGFHEVDTITIQTGLLSLELACHQVLSLFPCPTLSQTDYATKANAICDSTICDSASYTSDLYIETWNYQGKEIPTINSIMNHMLSYFVSPSGTNTICDSTSALDSMRAQYASIVSNEKASASVAIP